MIPTFEPSEEELERETELAIRHAQQSEAPPKEHTLDDDDRRRSVQGSSAVARNDLGLRDRRCFFFLLMEFAPLGNTKKV